MVKTRGGSTSGTRKEGSQTSRTNNRVGETTDGQPISLQSNLEHKEQVQPEHSGTSSRMGMHVSPIESDSGKNPNLGPDFTEKVTSTETLISHVGGNKEGVNADSQHIEVENVVDEKSIDPERVSREVEGVNPSVKDISSETNYKSAKTHSSADPTVAKILAGMRGWWSCWKRGRRTRTSVAALEKKRVALGVGGDVGGSVEPDKAIDVEELERLVLKKKKAAKRGKGKAKRPSNNEPQGSEAFDGKDAARAARRRSKGKLKVNDDKNRINNRRIARDVEDVLIEGIDFSGGENEARWKFVCARNILPERFLSEATIKNQTYMDIMEEPGMLAIMGDIGPHWLSLVREFICNLSEDIADPSRPVFHKVKMKGFVFDFSPLLINRHYGR
ncbi:hypothetical protein LIER_12974 [Lithospermum erythrorhizon]|uniref:Uncharacterized protein n=1 Tax=Lithospermum erythrorhizon TaxID=34254 RepID=A0AAV3PW86_LITER